MTKEDFKTLKIGHQVICVNGDGWDDTFQPGCTYTVTEDYESSWGGLDLDGHPVADVFCYDFEVCHQ